jgi:acetoin utilization deacetylase AcuC-like enzyme
MGFCLVNNVAVCAQYARLRHGLERVAIVDIDVHHGNGTQDAFYADPGVLYVSTHQYPYYPGTGPASETGAGDAKGLNVNIPLPAGCGDEEYAQVFERRSSRWCGGSSRSSCSCRAGSTRTSPTRSRAWS